jgi:hypothetical protein
LLANNAYPAIERHANFCADARLSAVRKWLQIVAYIRGRLRGTAAWALCGHRDRHHDPLAAGWSG